jgi:fucose-1-phosphate guanylyltransferase
VFVTCADDIELIDCEGELEFTAKGFTALGHPSSLEIGTTHGVFVLDEASRALAADDSRPPCTRAACSRFTHKPSVARMKELGAEIAGSDLVYTDSAYYFDCATARKLRDFWTANGPLACEIDAYGDFLQALGPAATDEYTRDAKNVIAAEGGLAETRLKLYHFLQNTPLTVILCKVSKFYHIGTVPEFLHHYCTDVFFRGETGAQHAAFTAGAAGADAGGWTVIHSVVDDGASVGKETVIEYSTVGARVKIGTRCLVSNTSLPAGAVVPDDTFLHTTRTTFGYVTIVFGTSEDLKTGAAFDRAAETLTYCNVKLADALPKLGCTVADLWADSKAKATFWDARAWPCFKTAEESVSYALQMATPTAAAVNPPLASLARLTMEDVLDNKDLDGILADRESLRQVIAAAASSGR